ncbi:MAG: aspartate/glutamate racemase family protein [Eggerthellaceae bacterium]|nr:aspartate/glutamate racemase family protein [Eggerthellaceae bacterium]
MLHVVRKDDVDAVACSRARDQRILEAPDFYELLERLVGNYRGCVDAVVLGCTHYPLAADEIRAVVGDVPLYDGSEGTARQLLRRLDEGDLHAPSDSRGEVEFRTSSTDAGAASLYQSFAQRVGLAAKTQVSMAGARQ